ncbi:MAG: DUF2442 domain-containing protein, partial [Merismopedia sp. SIO2A8]|nr:DUF2442 domain-containing protein [Merismopedia sp. SIO2A8]
MTSLTIDRIDSQTVKRVEVTDEFLTVNLMDGRVISAPVTWYPRLLNASQAERENWRLTGGKTGIHWPDLDEDISIRNIILGQPSGESQKSLQRWLNSRG